MDYGELVRQAMRYLPGGDDPINSLARSLGGDRLFPMERLRRYQAQRELPPELVQALQSNAPVMQQPVDPYSQGPVPGLLGTRIGRGVGP